MALDLNELTPRQQEVVRHWQAFNVPGDWSLVSRDTEGVVEVVMKKSDGHSWSLVINPWGDAAEGMRSPDGEWTEGIVF